MSRRASSRRILSLPEIVQLALESDDYSDTVEDSSGDEYRPGEDEVADIESDEEIPLQPVGVSHSHDERVGQQPTHASLGFPPSPTGVVAHNVDRGNMDDTLGFLFPQGRRPTNVEEEEEEEIALPRPKLPSPPPPVPSPVKCTARVVDCKRKRESSATSVMSECESDSENEHPSPHHPATKVSLACGLSHKRSSSPQAGTSRGLLPRAKPLLTTSPPATPRPFASPPASPQPTVASPQDSPTPVPSTIASPPSSHQPVVTSICSRRQQSGRAFSRGRGSRVTRVHTTIDSSSKGSSRSTSKSRSRSKRHTAMGSSHRTSRDGNVRVDQQEWEWVDGADYVPNTYHFQGERTAGPTIPNANHQNTTRLAVFLQFFTANLIDLICDQTNWYNFYFMAGKVQSTHSARLSWTDVEPKEMYVFLAIVLLMGVTSKSSVKKYWGIDPLVNTPIFGKLMSRNRFTAIMGNLHFSDSLRGHITIQEGGQKDTMERIRPVFQYLKVKFAAAFRPYQKLVIDESLVLWRGNISIRQYIPSKRHRYGLKLFVLCDCKTGYIQDLLLYMGAKTELLPERQHGISGAVVITMMQDYLNRGHILYLDNWYSSPSLCLYLHKHNTGMCGTVRRNRSYMPELPTRREKGSIIHMQANNVLLISWMDNRDVNLLTSLHPPAFEDARRRDRATGERLQKPAAVNDYNINMRLVDKSDAVISSVECARKTMRWHKKMFFHLLDVTVYNSHILYSHITGVKESMEDFTIELARDLLATNMTQERVPHHQPNVGRRSGAVAADGPARLVERHFCRFIPPTPHKEKPTRRCHVCSNTTRRQTRRKDTRSYCRECNVGLCYDQCFIDYHTLLQF